MNYTGGSLTLCSIEFNALQNATCWIWNSFYAADDECNYLREIPSLFGFEGVFSCFLLYGMCGVVWLCVHTRRLDCTLAQSESVRSFHCQLWESCINLHVFPQRGAIFELGSHWYRVYPGTRGKKKQKPWHTKCRLCKTKDLPWWDHHGFPLHREPKPSHIILKQVHSKLKLLSSATH